jgi:voltage-dependent calcium channel
VQRREYLLSDCDAQAYTHDRVQTRPVHPRRRRRLVKDFYESIRWCWVALALASLVLQATGSDNADDTHKEIIDKGELILTIVFDVEIVIRVIAYLPDWRAFAARGQNWLDLILAIGSTIIQIPVIHNSNVYPWLTIFQLARFYRVILEIPRVKPLLVSIRDLHIIRFAKCSSAGSVR